MSNRPLTNTKMQAPQTDQSFLLTDKHGKSVVFDPQVLKQSISKRLTGLSDVIDLNLVLTKLQTAMSPGMTIDNMINLVAETCAYMSIRHPDYALLAGRIKVNELHKQVAPTFSQAISQMYHYIHPKTKSRSMTIGEKTYQVVMEHQKRLDQAVEDHKANDFTYEYFSYKTLERSYLIKQNDRIQETPQYLWMRLAVGIHGMDIDAVIETYLLVSYGFGIHGSPALFNAGREKPQMSSCFLLNMEDSIEGIYKTLTDCAKISKNAGGIGFAAHKIRASGSYITGTNGQSHGLVPMLRVFNDTARYANQGGNRKGAFACYLEPWHADVFEFIELRKNHGKEELRARDLFLALWIPDLFMERVERDENWSLFCPNEAPGLFEVWGDEFLALFTRYEREGLARRTFPARELWSAIMDAHIETGVPYLLYKDACNSKSNQQNLGTIQCSNLCVTPDTLLLTDQGYKAIGSLENQAVNVWNGRSWSQSTVYKTNTDQELVRVTFNNGTQIDCTPYHKFYMADPNCTEQELSGDLISLCAHELQSGMSLCRWTMPEGYETPNDYVRVVSVEKLDYRSDVYCLNEPERHAVIFNGVMTGNCTEIVEFTSETESAVCNLASLALPKFVNEETMTFDFDHLAVVTKVLTRNLNKVIDVNFYPTIETKTSNLRHRPIGLGVQGLADTFAKLKMPFGSKASRQLNKDIFETIYFAAISASNELAKRDGPYETFHGSPMSKGIFQFDMWDSDKRLTSDRWNWDELKSSVIRHGVRNSLFVAPMPTASTAQILNNNEATEPFTSNLYSRRVLSGDFPVINKHLVKDLIELGLWDENVINQVVAHRGSVQNIAVIPQHIKDLYKTVWEMSQAILIDMAADRAVFVDQSQSMNLFPANLDEDRLTSMHFYAWKKGLKTGLYYMRTQPAANAIQFTVDQDLLGKSLVNEANRADPVEETAAVCQRRVGDDGEICIVCSS